jgi:polyferredoxin
VTGGRKGTPNHALWKLTVGLLVTWAFVLAASLSAHAHGGKAVSAKEAGAGFLQVGRYQFLLEQNPHPFTVGKEFPLTVRIYDTRLQQLVSGRTVLLAAKLPQIILPAGADGASMSASASEPTDDHQTYLSSPFQWTQEGRPDLTGFQRAVEVTPGHYQILFKPTIEGPYFLKVALLSDNNPGDGTLTQFYFQVAPPRGWDMRFLTVSGIFLLLVVAGAGAVGLRFRFPDKRWSEINFLDLSPLKRFFQWRYFQPAFQIPLLVIFVLIVILGLFDTQNAGKNLATRLTWTLWWAGVIFTFVLVGRVWCLMCPYGAVTEWTSRLVQPRRRFPKPLRNLWLANFLFLGLTWVDGYFGLVGSPRATAWFLLLIFLVAVSVGALFPRRTFCRYVCPIGGLIGLYSMVSPVELRAEDKLVCKAHKGFDCYVGNERGYGCPMFEDPRRMDTNIYCSFCGECVKTCPESNITLRLRPFAKDLWTKLRGHADEAIMAIALVGVTLMATGHMIQPWHQWMDSFAALLPLRSFGISDHTTIERVMYTLTLLSGTGAIIALTWAAAGVSRWLAGSSSTLSTWDTLKYFGYMFIPIGLAAHLSHNLLHLMEEAPMVIPVLQKTVNAYTPFFLGRPNWRIQPLMGLDAVYWLQMATFLFLFAYTLMAGYRIACQVYTNGQVALRAVSPMVLLALGFALLNVFLLSQGMAPRH